MYDADELIERLEDVVDVLERILRRFSGVKSADYFFSSDEGIDRLDAICMSLIALGETFKQIDSKSNNTLLTRYPEIEWRGVIGVRNVIAHGYFDIDVEQVFNICQNDIPALSEVVQKMIDDMR